jgi:iron complex transport system substrate-binding protein
MPFRTPRRRRGRLVALALPLLLAVAACGSSSKSSSSEPSQSAFTPVTIKHVFGETVIKTQPKRVVQWGWGSGDAAIALGVVPVAIPKNTYGADKDGYMPWVREALEAKKLALPTEISNGDDPPYEEIIKAKPDVILANYSGITQKQYDTLAKIAPTVAYPDQPWSTPWRDVITTVGQVLGKSAEATKLLSDIDEKVKEAADAHPEFKGKTIAAVASDPSAFYVYKPADPRVEFLTDLGFVNAPSVDKLANGNVSFYYTLSKEKLDELTSDVLLSYAASPDAQEKILKSAPLQTMEQVKKGTVASVTGEAVVSSVSPPTALSLTWSLDDVVSALSKAAKA